MKCVCGHEGEDFMILMIDKQSCGIFCDGEDVYIFSCPICGTLKFEIKKEEKS